MKFNHYFVALSLSGFALASPLQQPEAAAPKSTSNSVAGAVYFLTNQPWGNFIISNAIGSDGTLTFGRAIWAGGLGQHGNSTGPDALFSQGSIQVAGGRVFAVNPGSNTVVMFHVSEKDPTHLTMIGKPVSSGGDFPVSISVSGKTGQVCVLNGGRVNGVNCYKQDDVFGLVSIQNTQRYLNLDLSTPPSGPENSVSQVLFSEDGTLLFATVKGSPASPGFIASWDVDPFTGALSEDFIRSTPSQGGALPFGMTLIPGRNAVVATDPGSGFEVFDFDGLTSAGAPSTVTAVKGEQAVCWVVHSKETGNFYMTDVGTSLVTEVHINSELQSTVLQQYPQGANASTLDDAIATVRGQDFLYVLAVGTRSVNVMTLKSAGAAAPLQQFEFANDIQTNVVSGNLDFNNLQGLAVHIH